MPDGAGLRLTAGHQSPEGVAVDITFVTEAEPADQVIETGAPADVFVAPDATELLDDKVLDAEITPDGQISFALHDQPSTDGRQL